MPNEVETLMEMGFPRNRAEKALAVTSNQGVHVAMDWLFAHADDPDIDKPYKPSEGHTLGSKDDMMDTESPEKPIEDSAKADEGSGETETTKEMVTEACADGATSPQQARSLVCEDCGKKMRSENEVQFHAAKTGHANFAESVDEIKPLTEEEKKQRLEKLQQRMAERRAEKQELEKKEKMEKEKMRRKTGKEISDMKHKMELEEARKLAELKKREKQEERLARQKVKEQIAKDKAERSQKFGKSNQDNSTSVQQLQPSASPAQPVQTEKKNYDTCKIQFRLTNGTTMTGSFQATDLLSTVQQYVSANRTDGSAPFALMTSFPRKTFTAADMNTTLKDAGLVPSAVLILTKL